jgi:hypothetical protein
LEVPRLEIPRNECKANITELSDTKTEEDITIPRGK